MVLFVSKAATILPAKSAAFGVVVTTTSKRYFYDKSLTNKYFIKNKYHNKYLTVFIFLEYKKNKVHSYQSLLDREISLYRTVVDYVNYYVSRSELYIFR